MKKIRNLYFSPIETFKEISEKPDWLVPVVITLIIVLGFTMLTLPRVIIPEREKKIMSMEELPEAYRERALESLKGIRIYLMTPLSIIVFTFIVIFLKSGIFYLLFTILGNRTVFKKILSVVSYSFLVGIPETILKSCLVLIKGNTEIYTSLIIFAPGFDFKSPLFKVLNRIDIFTIWNLILISLGFSVIYNISRKKSYMVVFASWVVWLIIVFAAGYILPKGFQMR
jgi:hypothetical protein